MGEDRPGGYAEAIVVPVTNVIARPPELAPAFAAAIPVTFPRGTAVWTDPREMDPREMAREETEASNGHHPDRTALRATQVATANRASASARS